MRYFILLLCLLPFFPLATLAADPMTIELTYPGASPSGKLKIQRYDKLEVFVRGKGYKPHYGETRTQNFNYPKFSDDSHKSKLRAFFAERLGFDTSLFSDDYASLTQNEATFFLKLSSYATSYSYTLLKVAPCPEVVALPVNSDYTLKKKGLEIPKHPLIPDVEGFGISASKYFDYDEVDFYYKRGKATHKGRHWELNFSTLTPKSDSYRYIVAHDYKSKLDAMGAEILEDKDNDFTFTLNGAVAKFSGYDNSFGLKIIQEESFKQALVLTPDAIKTELDKNGKITLEGIYFDFDKATLKSESRKAILSAVALMQRYPDLILSVNGYTDGKGSDEYNRKLSAARAASVKAAMEAEGIAATRLSYKGHGEEDPVADNATEEGRAQNRRVELHKEGGGKERSVISIDFIKPIDGSIIDSRRRYDDTQSLGIEKTQPYFPKRTHLEYKGHLDVINYKIMKDGKQDKAFSRKAIIKNYENVLELYNAKIVGHYSDQLSFEIPDRGDGVSVYGRIDAYDGSYAIRFLIPQ